MTPINYTPKPKKTIRSYSIDTDVVVWIENELPKSDRSDYVNSLIRAEMLRTQEAKRRGIKVRPVSVQS